MSTRAAVEHRRLARAAPKAEARDGGLAGAPAGQGSPSCGRTDDRGARHGTARRRVLPGRGEMRIGPARRKASHEIMPGYYYSAAMQLISRPFSWPG